jgi:ferric-dicitrate binding protein FerR (iron transport regulator)
VFSEVLSRELAVAGAGAPTLGRGTLAEGDALDSRRLGADAKDGEAGSGERSPSTLADGSKVVV